MLNVLFANFAAEGGEEEHALLEEAPAPSENSKTPPKAAVRPKVPLGGPERKKAERSEKKAKPKAFTVKKLAPKKIKPAKAAKKLGKKQAKKSKKKK